MLVAEVLRGEKAPMARDLELEALRAGDERTLEQMMNRYHGPMMRIAYGYCRDQQRAEDVVQEAWLTFLQSLDRFEGRSSLKTWLFGILMNIARAHQRSESRLVPFSSLFRRRERDIKGPAADPKRFDARGDWSDPPASWEKTPEQVFMSQETLAHIDSAIAALPARYRDVILLRDVAGWSADETSSLLGISAVNQRVRLHRARAVVREKLEEYLR